MENRKLTELEISEKLCDIACKIQQVMLMFKATNVRFEGKYYSTNNALEAIKQNLISLVKEVEFENLTYFQKRIAKNAYRELKSATTSRTVNNTLEENVICEQLGKD